MSLQAVPNLNRCIRARTNSELSALVGLLLFEDAAADGRNAQIGIIRRRRSELVKSTLERSLLVPKSSRPCENSTKFSKRLRRAKFFAIFSILKGLRARKSEQNGCV